MPVPPAENSDLGQFVVMGEPVAIMGGGVQSALVKAGGTSQPVLYVEFRKDGIPSTQIHGGPQTEARARMMMRKTSRYSSARRQA